MKKDGGPRMSLREWYAGQALLRLNLKYPEQIHVQFEEVAKICFEMADAMLKEGERKS